MLGGQGVPPVVGSRLLGCPATMAAPVVLKTPNYDFFLTLAYPGASAKVEKKHCPPKHKHLCPLSTKNTMAFLGSDSPPVRLSERLWASLRDLWRPPPALDRKRIFCSRKNTEKHLGAERHLKGWFFFRKANYLFLFLVGYC